MKATASGMLTALTLVLFSIAPATAKPKLHMIVMADTADEGIAVDLAIDAANYITLANTIAQKTGMTLKLYTSMKGPFPLTGTDDDGNTTTTLKKKKSKHPDIVSKAPLAEIRKGETKFPFTKTGIRKLVSNLKVSKGKDVIWFAYAGHGFRWDDQDTVKANFPALDLDEWTVRSGNGSFDDDNDEKQAAANSILFREVFESLEDKKARLTISITDSCNGEVGFDMPDGTGKSRGARGANLKNGLLRLFMSATGYVRIASSEPGASAYGDAVYGGVFSYLFFKGFMKEAQQGKKAKWADILSPFKCKKAGACKNAIDGAMLKGQKSCRSYTECDEDYECAKECDGLSEAACEQKVGKCSTGTPQEPQVEFKINYGKGSKTESGDSGSGPGQKSSDSKTCKLSQVFPRKPKCDCPQGATLRRKKVGFIKAYVCIRNSKTNGQAGKRPKPKAKAKPQCSEGLPRDGACVIAGARLPKEFGTCRKGKACRCTVVGATRKRGKATVHCVPKGNKCPKGWRRGTLNPTVKVMGKKYRFGIQTCTLLPFGAKRSSSCKPEPNLVGVRMSAKLLKSKRPRVKPKGFHANRKCPYWIDSEKGVVFGPATLSAAQRRAAAKAVKSMRKKVKGKRSWFGGKKKKKKKKKKK